ncbi:sugar ABC transporter ATP-binding protein [Bradyrhizobium liaoningense]|uniref:sugar ABC transporter ATP-binding protein n=1 Tax=Bradyrhizobium liaoningense TaxID=43992 RepID=UPI001BA75B46|nr:sugar ABC transporter ATP-binding protein [Bradyrhizobium liaoningense]MBR0842140.1 sugar ABC transporter ATP-binding protein [Bradyrhizobium liaoningense]MBR0858108.1 sugar ABC transporter ATP-binding protein [Bradyrhizobium liaoningense]
MQHILEIRNGTKLFGRIPAFEDVDFAVSPGEVHAILGENGAGKSTLTKVLAGVYKLTAGEMLLNGTPVHLSAPAEGLKHGIVMVYQETNLVPSMTVAQNIYLGEEKTFNRLRGLYIQARQFLAGMGFQVDPTAQVSQLGAAQKQMVEIARAVHHKAKVIIFDEPTATLTPEEKRHFFNLIRRLVADRVAIIFISHALEEALQLADRITILRDGRLVASDVKAAFTRDTIIQAMVGRSLTETLHGDRGRLPRPYGERVLSVENLSSGTMVRNTSFSIFAGQVTGVFGLVGAGRTEMMKVVAGVLKRDIFHGGEIKYCGRSVRYRVPRKAVRDGIVYVTEDRKFDGFFETMTVAENLHLGELSRSSNPLSVISMTQAKELARRWAGRLQLRSINEKARVIELSGGNQQKVVIARSLIQKPRLIIFDEPTRGVDVGAIVEIHQFINSLADEGLAVVVISSYLPEVLALSDRILVAKRGKIVEEIKATEATEQQIMYAAVH